MVTCIFDFETRSDVELKGSNVYVYTESPNADVWALAYCFDDDPVKIWHPSLGEPPRDLMEYVRSGGIMTAHNVAFDRVVWNAVCVPKYGFPSLPIEQCRCTMVQALALNLPAGLDDCAGALGLSEKKDEKGGRIAMQLAKPRSNKNGIVTWWTEEEVPEKYEAARAYCVQDVNLARQVSKRLLPLRDSELQAWFYNERANDRGIPIDVVSALAGKKFVADLAGEFDAEIVAVTKGDVASVTNVGQITAWLGKKGIPVKSIAKDKLEELLSQSGLPDDVRRVLELRRDGGKSSVAKIDAMLDRRTKDGRVKGAMQFHGASTGRVSHRGFQPGNMPRSVLLDSEDEELAYRQMDEILSYIRAGDPDMIRMMYGSPMFAVSDVLRGLIKVSADREMFDFDFSNIEGRGLAWAAKEEWKLAAFRAYDNGVGPDLYKVAAGGIFGCSPSEVTKPQRQIGKVSELSLGYGGGPSAFDKMALGYGLRIAQQADVVLASMPQDVIKRAEDGWQQRGVKSGMAKEAWIPAECVKIRWRGDHPGVVTLWHDIEGAAINAVSHPGEIFSASVFKFRKAGSFLFARLPSGRCLSYPYPRLHQVLRITKTENGVVLTKPIKAKDLDYWTKAGWEPDGDGKVGLVFRAVDSFTKKWCEQFTYSGKLTENCLSADTEVLTPSGWKGITSITTKDLLWDGGQWVSHDGLIYQGARKTIDVNGVRMTPEHKVWTENGWEEARTVSREDAKKASSLPRPYRDGSWVRHRFEICGERRQERVLGHSVRLWNSFHRGIVGLRPRELSELRMQDEDVDREGQHKTRSRTARVVRRLARYGSAVSRALTSSVQELWRAGDNCVRRLENFHEFLGGHGPFVEERANPGTLGQQRTLLQGELRVGDVHTSGEEHPAEQGDRHPYGALAGVRGVGTLRYRGDDTPVQSVCGVARAASVRAPRKLEAAGVIEDVFDLLNAGPNHRFTVRTSDGGSMIVSNCIQALARDLMVEAQIRLEDAGFDVLFTVHDEVCSEAKLGTRDLEEYLSIAAELPDWAAGMPVAVAGWKGERFRK